MPAASPGGADGVPSRARDHSASRCRTAARHHAACSSSAQPSATGSATMSLGRTAAEPAGQVSSGADSTNWPSHHDRSPRPPEASAPPRPAASPRRTRAAPPPRSTPLAGPVQGHAGRRPPRHPPASAEPGSADSSSAAVARTLRLRSDSAHSRNGSSASESPLAQRVQEHQPVLGPLGRPGRGEQRAAPPLRVVRAGPLAEERHPLREQPLLPKELYGFGVPGRRAAPRRPDAPRSAKRHSGLSRASHSPRGPAKVSACGRRSVRARAASSRARTVRQRARGNPARSRRPATAGAARPDPAPRPAPPPGMRGRRTVGEQLCQAADARPPATPAAASGGAGSGRAAAAAGSSPPCAAVSAAPRRRAGAALPFRAHDLRRRLRRSVPSSAAVTSSSQDVEGSRPYRCAVIVPGSPLTPVPSGGAGRVGRAGHRVLRTYILGSSAGVRGRRRRPPGGASHERSAPWPPVARSIPGVRGAAGRAAVAVTSAGPLRHVPRTRPRADVKPRWPHSPKTVTGPPPDSATSFHRPARAEAAGAIGRANSPVGVGQLPAAAAGLGHGYDLGQRHRPGVQPGVVQQRRCRTRSTRRGRRAARRRRPAGSACRTARPARPAAGPRPGTASGRRRSPGRPAAPGRGARPAAPKSSTSAERPDSLPYSQIRRVVSFASAASYWARTCQLSRIARALAGDGQADAGTDRRGQRLRQRGRGPARPGPADAAARTPRAAAPASPAPTPESRPTPVPVPASPGACASTMRAAVSSHRPYPGLLRRRESAAQQIRQPLLQLHGARGDPRSARRSARRLAASGSAGFRRSAPLRSGPRSRSSPPSASAPPSHRPPSPARVPPRPRPSRPPPRAAAVPPRACTGTSGSGNCTCMPGPLCRPPSGTACCRCPCTGPTRPPCRRTRSATTARPCRACCPPCVTHRQAPVRAPAPPSSAPPADSCPRRYGRTTDNRP